MPNPRETYYALNALGGAYVKIPLTMMARFVEFLEDISPNSPNGGVAQGLVGNKIDPVTLALTPPVAGNGKWVQANPEAVPTVVFSLGDPRAVHGGMGVPVGGTGAVVAQLTSATATPTQVIVREYF